MRDACGESALPYCTVAWWVKAFRDGRQNVSDMQRPGRPAVSEEDAQNVNALMIADRNITIRKLANNALSL